MADENGKCSISGFAALNLSYERRTLRPRRFVLEIIIPQDAQRRHGRGVAQGEQPKAGLAQQEQKHDHWRLQMVLPGR
jgi:hypothetical protein